MNAAALLLPALMTAGLLAIPAVGANPVVDHEWGGISDGLPAAQADPVAVALAAGDRPCVEPADATMDHLDALVVAANDYTGVHLVPFDTGFAASKAGEVVIILACGR